MTTEPILDDSLLGIILFDKYVIEKRLGSGYTAVVYRAKQIKINQGRAIKILRHEHAENPKIVEQLQKEVIHQSGITHRNIVKIIDYGDYKGLPVVIQEYVDGGSLREWLNKGKTIHPEADIILQVLDDLLSAVSYMHDKNLMHMDIKPENILVSSDNSFRLADFGLVKKRGGDGLTPIQGTPDYMHPDLKNIEVLPRDKIRFEFDCFSIGCLIENDLLDLYKIVANKDDYEFLKLIARKAKNCDGVHYDNVRSIQQDLDKLRNRYLPSTNVEEFSLRTSFTPTIRVPPEVSVNTTKRVLRIINSPYFQRLRNIKQLGPISLVYPGATHTRFEHSLGCFSNTRRYLDALLRQPRFRFAIDNESDVLAVLAAALLHDIGHYPFSHAVEEARRLIAEKSDDLPELKHELLARKIIFNDNLPYEVYKQQKKDNYTLADQLSEEWKVDPEMVCRLISGQTKGNSKESLLSSIINGPIDADKMDYLERDSIHTGVPYGSYIDKNRFFSSLTVDKEGENICLTDKGRIAAETFIFCRYAMTSEVYWHHTVRAANTMIVHAIMILLQEVRVDSNKLLEILLLHSDQDFLERLAREGANTEASSLIRAILTPNRQIYKRLSTYSKVYNERHKQDIFKKIQFCETKELRSLQEKINQRILELAGMSDSGKYLVLIDVPPKEKDIDQSVNILYPRVSVGEKQYYDLSELSSIAEGLGKDFQRSVKKIRIFCKHEIIDNLRKNSTDVQNDINEILSQ